MSQLLHNIARLTARPHRPLLHVRYAHRRAGPSSLSRPAPLTTATRAVISTKSPAHDSTERQGRSIRDEDDYQQQPPLQPERPQHKPQPTARPTHATAAATPHATNAASPASHTALPADAHAYFRVPPSASSPSSTAVPPSMGGAGTAAMQGGQPLGDVANYLNYLNTNLTNNFMRTLHLSNQTRAVKGVVLAVSILAVLGLSAYLFRDSVKTTTAEQVADVAKRSLADSDVQNQVNTLSQDVVHRLLTDQAVLSTALQFTQRLLHEPGTQSALQNLLQRLLAEPKTLDWGKEYSTRLVAQLTADEKVQKMVADLVKGALLQDNNRETLITLLKDTVNDERSMAELRKVGSQSACDVMNDEAVQQRMTEFMKGVLADSTLQQQAGDALWSAVRYSIRTPWAKTAQAKDDKDKQGVKGAADGAPSLSRPISAPLGAEAGGVEPMSAADGLRDAVSMTPRAPDGSRAAPHSSAPTLPASSSSTPSSVASSHSPLQPSASNDRADLPTSYLPVVHSPFAVASALESEDLTPTFTINVVNPHHPHPA